MVEKNEEILNVKYASIVVSITIVMSLLLAFTLGRHLWHDLQKTSSELKLKREVLKADKIRLANLKQLKEKEEELKAQNKLVLDALPKDTDIAGLFVQFERIASLSGTFLKSSAESQNADKNSKNQTAIIEEILYSLDGQSNNYSSYKDFLSKTQDALRIISIEDLEITSQSGTLGVKVTTKTFSRK